ncbi:sodium-dependent transporter [Thermococcus sp. SY098]|uniref:sodium-dependent transporter n=1 Tax=Thermococcus sp. SY098 TaxID=3111325 RepID=UPI002D79B161|nr:sodium-dependent transporter [Thermococcus sp. SY098]WRS52201.1 sodium-dependent transporter [Thermococcus sp. SY098]
MEQRDRWATKLGLILAMAGNAIGLGNFWRFPYQLASNGGGAFMIPYFIALFFLGIPVMWIEWTTGRYGGKYGHGTLGPMFYLMARESVKPKTALIFGIIGGMLAFSVSSLLSSYYYQVIGWSAAYTYYSLTGAYFGQDTVKFFLNYVANLKAVIFFWGITMVLLGIAVGQGVSKGIERWVKVMMPLLYVFAILLVIRALTLGSPVKPEWSSIKGLEYIWTPNFTALKQNFFKISLAAAGQIFFTLSLGMGIIHNYASYLGPEDDVALSGLATVSLNEFAEVILGGSLAIPIAFAYLGPEQAIKGGVGLAYMALPNVFMHMPGGRIFGAMWFLLLWFAGFTSAIATYNYLVAMLEEDLKIDRKVGTWLVFIFLFLLGLPVALDSSLVYLSELDMWVGSYFLVLLGFFDVIVGVWLFKPDNFWEELHKGAFINVPEWFKPIIMYIAPIFMAVLLIGNTKDYYSMGALRFHVSKAYVENVLGGSYPDAVPLVLRARIVILIILIIGAIEAYLAIKKKYGEELEKNEVIIKV